MGVPRMHMTRDVDVLAENGPVHGIDLLDWGASASIWDYVKAALEGQYSAWKSALGTAKSVAIWTSDRYFDIGTGSVIGGDLVVVHASQVELALESIVIGRHPQWKYKSVSTEVQGYAALEIAIVIG